MIKHLIQTNDLSIQEINIIVEKTIEYFNKNTFSDILNKHIIVTFFLEPSTRTMLSFNMAAQRLGANIVNIEATKSSLTKGEDIIDTISTIDAMKPSALIMRSNLNDINHLTQYCESCSLINAGSGTAEHPTQALLDMATIIFYKEKISNLNIAICGDTLHSRVARSAIKLFSIFGANITIISPSHLSLQLTEINNIPNIKILHKISSDILHAQDVLMSLRIQKERGGSQNSSYIEDFCITEKIVAMLNKNAIIMHPGPVNKNIDISEEALKDPRVVIKTQVTMGLFLRQALLQYIVKPESFKN